MDPKYSIVIISYNGIYRVPHLLRSIQLNTKVPRDQYEIILVDDGSFKDAREVIENSCKKYDVRYFRNEKNMGIVKSWNRGVSEARSNNIALLNDDLIMTPNWLRAGMYFLENNENVGAVGYPTFFMVEEDMPSYFIANYLRPKDPFTKKHITKELEEELLERQDWIVGACAVVVGCAFCFTKEVWEKVGRFDENIKSLYEDYAFGTELLLHGYQNYMLRSPIIYHVLSGTFGSNPQLRAHSVMQESEQYYIKKYGGKVGDVADKLFEKQSKSVRVKYLDRDGMPSSGMCMV